MNKSFNSTLDFLTPYPYIPHILNNIYLIPLILPINIPHMLLPKLQILSNYYCHTAHQRNLQIDSIELPILISSSHPDQATYMHQNSNS